MGSSKIINMIQTDAKDAENIPDKIEEPEPTAIIQNTPEPVLEGMTLTWSNALFRIFSNPRRN